MAGRPSPSKEQRILRAVKHVLTRIIKETATPPGLKHPLSEECIEDLRQCLVLIAAREHELAESQGGASTARPRFADEPKAQGPVVVPLSQIGRKRDK